MSRFLLGLGMMFFAGYGLSAVLTLCGLEISNPLYWIIGIPVAGFIVVPAVEDIVDNLYD